MEKKSLTFLVAMLFGVVSASAQYVDGGMTGPLTWELTGTGNNLINENAFGALFGLADVYVEWPIPLSISEDVFKSVTTKNVNLHVPSGTESLYAAHPAWGKFDIVKISGTVMRQDLTPLDKGEVSLYKATTGYYTLIQTVPIGNDGTYLFIQVDDGDYVVRAIPDESEYAFPTYYGNTEYWDEATIVTVANSISVESIDIMIIPYNGMQGTSLISGLVLYEDDGRGAEPAEGVNVYIQISEQGDVYQTVGGTTTDVTGSFIFEYLHAGKYRVKLDVPGLVTAPFPDLDLPEGDSITNIVFTIPPPPLGINSPAKEEKIKVYPNPTSGELIIDNGQLTIDNVEIFDVMGRKHEGEKSPSKGGVRGGPETLNISNLPTGIYFIRIQTNEGSVTKKIIKQ